MSDSLYISQLPAASSAALTDIIPATQGSSGPGTGNTRGVTLLQDLTALGLLPKVTGPASTIWLPTLSGAGGTLAISPTSTMTWVASGGTTARTLGNRFSDIINVKDYGAVMDGVTSDTAAFQAARNATIANYAGTGIAFVPPGGFSTSVPTGAGYILWQMSGNCYGTGLDPVGNMGTDVVQTVLSGGEFFLTRAQSDTTHGDVARIDQTITHTGGTNGNVMAGLKINSTVESQGAALNNYTWALSVAQTCSTYGPNQNVAISASQFRPYDALTDGLGPRGPIWGFGAQVTDSTGANSTVSGVMLGLELDMAANNTDAGNYRIGISVDCGTAVSSGVAGQIGQGVRVRTAPNLGSSVGTAFTMLGAFYNAAFDASEGTSIRNAPAYRMASGQFFDLTGDSAHTLSYAGRSLFRDGQSGYDIRHGDLYCRDGCVLPTAVMCEEKSS